MAMISSDLIRNGYYIFMVAAMIGSWAGSYLASRAGVHTEMKNILLRQDRAEKTITDIQGEITKLTHAIGWLEGWVKAQRDESR